MLSSAVVLRQVLLGTAVVAALTINCGGDSARDDDDDGGESGDGGFCFGCAARGGASGAGSGGGGQAGASAGMNAGGSTAGLSGAAGANALAGRSGAGGSGSGAVSGAGAGGQSGAGASGKGGSGGANATGLKVSRVAFYQATEVPLWEDGETVTDAVAPVVAERAGLLRIWLEPDASFTPGRVTAELTVETGSTSVTVPATELNVTGPSTDANLASTLTFSLGATGVTEATRLSLHIDDAETGSRLVTWPETGTQPLNAESANGPFSVTLVPLTSGGFTPELTAEIVTRYQKHIEKIYPAPSVSIEVREPLVLDFDVDPDGTGWDQALDQLYEVRGEDDPDPNTYYYGVLTPGRSLDAYCPEGCVVGLAAVAGRTQEIYRGGIGTGFFESASDTFTQETLEHELGHALGRDHSPCDTGDGVDPNYPYPDGGIGSWGWDGTRLRNPSTDTDVMGYCVPVWISDYTYSAIFSRIQYVNGLAMRTRAGFTTRAAKTRVRTLSVKPDGSLRWGREKNGRGAFGSDAESVDLLDASGNVIDRVNAAFAAFDHLPGGFVTLPAEALTRPGVAAVRVGDESIAVP